jgi:hypothetical protein
VIRVDVGIRCLLFWAPLLLTARPHANPAQADPSPTPRSLHGVGFHADIDQVIGLEHLQGLRFGQGLGDHRTFSHFNGRIPYEPGFVGLQNKTSENRQAENTGYNRNHCAELRARKR